MKKRILSMLIALAMVLSLMPEIGLTVSAVENTGSDFSRSFATTEGKWSGSSTANLIPVPVLPAYSTEDGVDVASWQSFWNNTMVPAGWGSMYISGHDDALQVFTDGTAPFIIRPTTRGTTGTNACLGGAGQSMDSYLGGVSYTVALSADDQALAHNGKLAVSASAEFYIEKEQSYYHGITIEYYNAAGIKLGTNASVTDAGTGGSASSHSDLRFANEKTVPADTVYIRFWFYNYGTGDDRKDVKNFEAHLSDSSALEDYTLYLKDGKAHKDNAEGVQVLPAGITYSGNAADGYTYTFTDVTFKTSAYTAIKIADSKATITLVGNNVVRGGTEAGYVSYGIDFGGSALTINGTGSLSVSAGNTASAYSFGIVLTSGSTLTVESGTVFANGGEASNWSSGIHTYGSMTVTGGTVTCYGGAAELASCGICSSKGLTVTGGTVTGIGRDATSSCGIYEQSSTVNLTGMEVYGGPDALHAVLTEGWTGKNSGRYMRIQKAPADHSHPECGDAGCAEHGAAVTWQALTFTSGVLHVAGGSDVVGVNEGGTHHPEYVYTLPAGNYYLAENIALDGYIDIDTGVAVNICLNGKTLSSTAGGYVISIASGSSAKGDLTVCDCAGGGTVDGGENAVVHSNGGPITVYGGTFTSSDSWRTAYIYGADIYGGSFINTGSGVALYNFMFDVNIYDGTFTAESGSAIDIDNLTVYGGTFTNNSSSDATIVIDDDDVPATFYGGTFTNNGGGMAMDNTTATTSEKFLAEGYEYSLLAGNTITDASAFSVVKAATSYDLWVGGVQVTSENAGNILGDGTASYNAETQTLTLKGFNGTEVYSMSNCCPVIYAEAVITIELVGTNTITITDINASHGIYARGDINFIGSGTLTITGSHYDPIHSEGSIAFGKSGEPSAFTGTVSATAAANSSAANAIKTPSTEAVAIYSGTVKAINYYSGFGKGVNSGTVTVNGGTLEAFGNGAGIIGTLAVEGVGMGVMAGESADTAAFVSTYAGESYVYVGQHYHPEYEKAIEDLNTAVTDLNKALADKASAKDLADAIAALDTAYKAADAALEELIEANEKDIADLRTALTNAEASLDAAIKQVAQDLETAKQNLQNQINSNDTDIAGLTQALAQLDAAYKAADAVINSSIADLKAEDTAIKQSISGLDAAYKAADAALDAAIQAVDKKLDKAVEDLSAAIAVGDADLQSKITALDAAYKAADAVINSSIANLKAEDTAIKQSISSLDVAYKAADTALQAAINKVAKDLADAKQALQTQIDALEADHDVDIQTLTQVLAQLDAAYKAADAVINSSIADLKAEDTAIKQSISSLDAAYKAADTALQAAINKVAKDLADAKQALQTQIDALEADHDVDIQTLTQALAQLDAAYKAADAVINSSIADLKAEDTAIKQSISGLDAAYKAADAALDIAVKAVQKNLDDAVSELESAIAQGKVDLTAELQAVKKALEYADSLINSEISKLKAEDAAIKQSIAALETALTAARSDLEALIAATKTELEDKISGVKAALEAAKAELAAAVVKNKADLSAEIAALQKAMEDANALLNADIAALDEAAKAALAALQTSLADSKTQLKAAIAAVAENLEAAKADLQNKLDTKAAVTELAAAVTELTNAYTAADAALKTALQGQIDADVAALKADLEAQLQAARKKLQAAVDTVQKNLDQAIGELNAAIAAGDTDLSNKIAALDEACKSADAILESKIDADVAALRVEMEQADAKLKEAIEALQANLDKLSQQTAENDKKHDAQITGLIIALAVTDMLVAAGAVLLLLKKKRVTVNS